jgi:hypothetical protein
VAFAAAGLSELADRYRKREWVRRTRDLAVLALERAEGELAALAQQTYEVLIGAVRQQCRQRVLEIRPAFRVPISDVQRHYWRAAVDLLGAQTTALTDARAPADKRLAKLLEADGDRVFAKAVAQLKSTLSGDAEPEASTSAEESQRPSRSSDPDHPHPTDKDAPSTTRTPSLPSPKPAWRRIAALRKRGASSAIALDIDSFVNRADEQTTALRSQWFALGEAVTQLAELLESEQARTVLEATLRLRNALWLYERSAQPPKVLSDDPVQRSLEAGIQKIERAQVAHHMVLGSLIACWELLEALDGIFRGRLGDCDAAKRHTTAKQQFDLIVGLDADAAELKKAFEDLRENATHLQQQAEMLGQRR